jgi:predicted glycosyltransferase
MVKQLKEFVPDYPIDGMASNTALLAFKNVDRNTAEAFHDIALMETDSQRRSNISGYTFLSSHHKLLFPLNGPHETGDAAAIAFHTTGRGSSQECCIELFKVDRYGDACGFPNDPDSVEKAKHMAIDLLVKEKFLTRQQADEIRAVPNALVKNAAMEYCGIDPEYADKIRPAANAEKHSPKALLWLESSLTPFHIKHMAQLAKAMQAKGIDVSVITSEDTLEKFKQHGGKITKAGYCATDSAIDFGKHTHFLPTLPSQKTYEALGSPYISSDYEPFQFIGTYEIGVERRLLLAKAMREEKPDMLVTSLWPSGYGPFSNEIMDMIAEGKEQNPTFRVYSLSNDIPYLDYEFNHPNRKGREFEKVHKAFIRGDGTIGMDQQVNMSSATKSKLQYVGHYIDPLPERTPMAQKDRKVLVTYGRKDNNWQGHSYYPYFHCVLQAAGLSALKKNPWDIVVSTDCPEDAFKAIKKEAADTATRNHMKISVRRAAPDKAFRQDIADAALRICDYDIYILDEVSTGVPAVVTVGEIGQWVCGARDGEQRLENLQSIGAPISVLDQFDINDPELLADKINEAYRHRHIPLVRKKFLLPTDAPDKTADGIVQDLKKLQETAHKYGFAELIPPIDLSPNPVLKAATSHQSQGDEKRNVKHRG